MIYPWMLAIILWFVRLVGQRIKISKKAEDWDARRVIMYFVQFLDPLLDGMHAGTKHLGKISSGSESRISVVREKSDLEKALKEAIEKKISRKLAEFERSTSGTSKRNGYPRLDISSMFHNMFSESMGSKRGPKSIPITLSTRIRLARNLRDFPFSGRAETSHKRAVLTQCIEAMESLKGLNDSMTVEVDDLSELDRQILVEKHLISPELSQVDEGSGIILSKDRNCCIMINEEDHLRIQVLQAGLDFKSVWKKLMSWIAVSIP